MESRVKLRHQMHKNLAQMLAEHAVTKEGFNWTPALRFLTSRLMDYAVEPALILELLNRLNQPDCPNAHAIADILHVLGELLQGEEVEVKFFHTVTFIRHNRANQPRSLYDSILMECGS